MGEAPGRNEDREGRPFVGMSGAFLDRVYLGVLHLERYADIFLTNACRCRPPANSTPTKGQINACRRWLLEDIRLLQQQYKEVLILCTGAPAVQSILAMSLQEAFARNGERQDWGWAGTEGLDPVRVFATYHPINLQSGRNPSRIAAIKDHLRLLHSYLCGSLSIPVDAPTPAICPPIPSYPISRLSLDIETYGIASCYPPQTAFHPRRSRYFDRPAEMVLTAALAWRDPDGHLQAAAFDLRKTSHRLRLLTFLRHLDGDLVGMNLKFDLLYLRDMDPRFRQVLRPPLPLTDLAVLNYLHNEQRPERSLKAIAPLLAITRYDAQERSRAGRFPAPNDPDLYRYNAKDAWATLRATEELERRIAADFPGSPKWSPYSREWYSRLLWVCLEMEEAGIAFDARDLEELDYQLVLEAELLKSQARHKWGLLLAGPGSEKSCRQLFSRAVDAAGLAGDRRIEATPKRQEISINQRNATLLLEHLPSTSELRPQIVLQQRFEGLQKIVTSYTRPLLYGTAKNPVGSRLIPAPLLYNSNLRAAIAYPSWFPVPSHAGNESVQGGTMQGRITSKGPACQTLPAVVKKCLCSRYRPGFLLCVDLSQIELRIAALLSGDAAMLAEYAGNPDLHTRTAKMIVEEVLAYLTLHRREGIEIHGVTYKCPELADFLAAENPRKQENFDLWRQAGKTANFLIIYRGTGRKLWATLSSDLGVDLPLEVCEGIVRTCFNRYPGLRTFHEELIATAKATGRIELPLIGQSRWFIGSAHAVEETYLNEIVNFPIQTTAANVMLDLQGKLMTALARELPAVRVGLNIYDSVFLDGPRSELENTLRLVKSCFASSDYLNLLCKSLARSVPLGYDISVLRKDALRTPSRVPA